MGRLLLPAGLSPRSDLQGRRVYAGRVDPDAGGTPVEVELSADDVVEIAWSDGTIAVLRADDLPAARAARGANVLPTPESAGTVAAPAVERVILGASPGSARDVAAEVEAGISGARGLRTVDAEGTLAGSPDPDGKRCILLLHGAFSNTALTFGPLLRGSPEWGELLEQFGADDEGDGKPARVLGFDHPTLTRGPVENAADLATALPKGASLSIVAHGHGGLLADVLAAACTRARGPRPPTVARDPEIRALDEALAALSKTCAERGIQVERTIRVAAPALGASLAGRPTTWLNVVLNVMGGVPALRDTPACAGVRALLRAIVAEGGAPALPGLLSAAPGSAFNRWLNALRAGDELSVVTGVSASPALLSRLRGVLPDLFVPPESDLLVDTSAMTGGAARATNSPTVTRRWRGGADLVLDHFRYFDIPTVRAFVVARLLGEPPSSGDVTVDSPAPSRSAARVRAATPGSTRATVVLLPEAMGSVLSRDGRTVWPSTSAVASGDLHDLPIGAEADEAADALIPGRYDALAAHLSTFDGADAFDVLPFPYDWRASLKRSAGRLADRLDALLAGDGPPVHLFAHGAGGLVARGIRAWHADTWSRLTARGGRLVMAGTPQFGRWDVARLLLGKHRLFDMLAAADLRHDRADLTDLLWTWAGIVALLPSARGSSARTAPLFDAAWWNVEGAAARVLGAAAAERDALADAFDDRMVSVVGRDADTPLDDAQEPGRLVLGATDAGDGVVTWESARLPSGTTWLLDLPHGALLSRHEWFGVWTQLLAHGRCTGLTALPSTTSRSRAARSDASPVLHPCDATLLGAAVGTTTPTARDLLSVTVVHGDVAMERGTLLVGHFAGFYLREAEPAVDVVLRRALSDRVKAGVYPQEIGAVAVVPANPAAAGSAARSEAQVAIVAGLGSRDRLSRGRVADAVEGAIVEAGMLTYRALFPGEGGEDPGLRSLAIAPPGCGTRGLPVEDTVAATLEGILLANRRLRASGQPAVTSVRLVFRFGDQAGAALRAAVEWSRSPGTALRPGEGLEITPTVSIREDQGWVPPSRPLNVREVARYQRIGVRGGDMGGTPSIDFLLPTTGAAGWVAPRPANWERIALLSRALTRESRLVETQVRALRAQVLPPQLAEVLESGLDVQIGVDRRTAGIPWEAFVSAGVREGAVLTGRISILRQLLDKEAPLQRTVTVRRALVVRSPGPIGDSYPYLPGAEEEARIVAGALSGAAFQVTEVAGGVLGILGELANPYQVVHLTGHGTYKAGDAANTGFVAEGGSVISRLDLRPLVANPPALVFVNCCHLGSLDSDNTALAADLAGFLVAEVGVQVVVAAGWEVDDTAAVAFSRTFYERMLRGDPLRLAVAHARVAARAAAPDTATWAAYQCYGDPDFVLPAATDARSSLDRELEALLESVDLATPQEAADLLGQVHGRLLLDDDRRAAERLSRATVARWNTFPPAWRAGAPRGRLQRLLATAGWAPERVAREAVIAAETEIRLEATWRAKPVLESVDAIQPAPLSFTEEVVAPTAAAAPPSYVDPGEIDALRQALAKDLGIEPPPPTGSPRGQCARGVYAVEQALGAGVARLVRGEALPEDAWAPTADAVAEALRYAEGQSLGRELDQWLRAVVRSLRNTDAEAPPAEARASEPLWAGKGPATERACHAGATALVRAIRARRPDFWQDPNLDRFGGYAGRDGFRVQAWRGPRTDRFHFVTRLTLPEAATGLVVYHHDPADQVWAFEKGVMERGPVQVWWAGSLGTLGASVYLGDPDALGYDRVPFAPRKKPDLTLELDLAQCPAGLPEVPDGPPLPGLRNLVARLRPR